MSKSKTYSFEAETSQILHLLTHSIYSNKEIFIRELVSNASDAIDKARIKSLVDTKYLWDDVEFKILIDIDKEKNIIIITDNGIWMTEDELIKNIWTIAKSWTKEFVQKLKDAKDNKMIWQFWVWFYSAFMVSDHIELETKSNDANISYIWVSDGKWSYKIKEWKKVTRWTEVRIHLNDDSKEFLEDYKIKEIIRKYSNYLQVPVMMKESVVNDNDDDANGQSSTNDKDSKKSIKSNDKQEYKSVNDMKAIWEKNKSDISQEEYQSFYQSISFDFNKPLCNIHLNIEWVINYKALLYIPHQKPMFGQNDQSYGPMLYVQNVMILEHTKDLLPAWLRFVKWVVETNDLPLNISRELLQNNQIVIKIKKWLVSKIIDRLKESNKEDPKSYDLFLDNFWSILKEWVHYDYEYKEQIAQLLKFESMSKWMKITFDEYIADIKESEKKIYYISWTSKSEVTSSPYLDYFKDKWIDVLLMCDAIDELVVQWLHEYKWIKLASITDLDINVDEATQKQVEEKQEKSKDFLEFIKKTIWEDKLEIVKYSSRLKESVGALATKQGWISPQMEKIMKAMWQAVPPSKRVFELNPDHSVVEQMNSVFKENPESEELKDLVKYAYEQAILAEWGELENVQDFIRRINRFIIK